MQLALQQLQDDPVGMYFIILPILFEYTKIYQVITGKITNLQH